MKTMTSVLAFLSIATFTQLSVLGHSQQVPFEPKAASSVQAAYGMLPLSFEANDGQCDPRVKFFFHGDGDGVFLLAGEAVLELRTPLQKVKPGPFVPQNLGVRDMITKSAFFGMRFLDANLQARINGIEELPGKSNYFIGNNPKKWHSNVPNYARVEYRNIYPGVNAYFYGQRGQLEYDFVLDSGTDARIIRLAFQGAEGLSVGRRGDLLIRTAAGERRFLRPRIYQSVNGYKKEIKGGYVIQGKREVGFWVGKYDTSRTLVIDPVLRYSTYLGGTSGDTALAVAVDHVGNVYTAGYTYSVDFPLTNAFQNTNKAGSGEYTAFITKINSTGSALLYSTYFGGSLGEIANGIAVDSLDNAYVTGYTVSSDFPTQNPLQAANAGSPDAFVTKLNPSGSALVYSTYLGGNGPDNATSIAVDSSGNAYVTGGTGSSNFPTANPLRSSRAGAFISKLSPDGSMLVYSSYLGGDTGGVGGTGVAVDGTGNAYVTGWTTSVDFPTKNPIQPKLGGEQDAFIMKLDAAGSPIVYSTYLGGLHSEFPTSIAVDSSGNTYVTGSTLSADFPVKNPVQATFAGTGDGHGDAFVTKIDNAGTALIYST